MLHANFDQHEFFLLVAQRHVLSGHQPTSHQHLEAYFLLIGFEQLQILGVGGSFVWGCGGEDDRGYQDQAQFSPHHIQSQLAINKQFEKRRVQENEGNQLGNTQFIGQKDEIGITEWLNICDMPKQQNRRTAQKQSRKRRFESTQTNFSELSEYVQNAFGWQSKIKLHIVIFGMSRLNIDPIQSIAVKHEKTLQSIHNHAIAHSHKVARQVYNLQSRNISQFIREQLLFKKKMAQKPITLNNHNTQAKRKRFGVTLRYEENQRLELSFDRYASSRDEELSTVTKVQNTVSDRDSRQEGFKSSKKSFLKSGNLSTFKMITKNSTNARNLSIPVHNRKKTLTFSSPRANVSTSNNQQSPIIKSRAARRRVVTQFQPADNSLELSHSKDKTNQSQTYGNTNQIIVMTKQKMNRFIKNLHKLAWMAEGLKGKPTEAEESQEFKQHLRRFHFDPDTPIAENKLNYMVARRYGLLTFYLEDHYGQKLKLLEQHQTAVKKLSLKSHKDYSLLDFASKKSILNIIQRNIEERPPKNTEGYRQIGDANEEKISFSLPFAEFISQRETKASIYRLVRMAPNSYLRMAFLLYDKNQNGIIDEDDLLQALGLSRKMPQLQSDLLLLCSNFNTPSRPLLRNRQKTISEREKSDRAKPSLMDQVKPIEQHQFQSRMQSQQQQEVKNPTNTAFSLDKFYIFLKEKKNDQTKDPIIRLKAPNISFNFSSFCKMFANRRPAILTDLFQFLFGAQKQDFTDNDDIVTLKPSGRVENLELNKEQTLEEKWNNRIKNTNSIVKQLLKDSRDL